MGEEHRERTADRLGRPVGDRVGQVQLDALAAQLQDQPLHPGRGLRGDGASHRGGSGEAHEVDVGMGREALGAGRALLDHDVEHAGRQPGLVGGLAEDDGLERGLRARPEHDAAAGHERGHDLPEVGRQREVGRRDRADHAYRLVSPGREPDRVARQVLAHRHLVVLPVGKGPGEVDEVAPTAEAHADLDHLGEPAGRARLRDHRLQEHVLARVERVGEAVHDRGALVARRTCPRTVVERASRRRDRGVDLLHRRGLDLGHRLLGGRIDDGERPGVAGDERTIDVRATAGDEIAHGCAAPEGRCTQRVRLVRGVRGCRARHRPSAATNGRPARRWPTAAGARPPAPTSCR